MAHRLNIELVAYRGSAGLHPGLKWVAEFLSNDVIRSKEYLLKAFELASKFTSKCARSGRQLHPLKAEY